MWATSDPGGNGESITYTLSKAGSTIMAPSWFILSLTGKTLTINTLLSSGITKLDVGMYTLIITGVIANLNDPATGLPWVATNQVYITILSDCYIATTLSGTVNNMVTYVGYQAT